MVRDVDNHGHKIWSPFSSGGIHSPIDGNASKNTFNDAQKMEFVLHANIIHSEYFQNALVPTEDIDDLIDEIYNEVSDVEPWMSGNARGASTAFCILYRILAMENVPHFKVNKMIYHQDSVYIRCIGLLYARYKFYNDEENLMKFFSEDVFKDKKEISFAPSVDGKKLTSFSQFAIDLICSQEYFETLFPRIPEVLKRKMQAKIESWLDGGKKWKQKVAAASASGGGVKATEKGESCP